MKKILVMFTGGTIGSKKNNKLINVDESTAYYLLDKYMESGYARDVEFVTIQPLNILSENLIPNDWLIMYKCLIENNFQTYDGVIITHGTDTLPFSAAALSYMLNDTLIPVVITASNYPLEDDKSNGLKNFISSVDFVLEKPACGVFVVYENNKGEAIVHLGTRLTEAVPFTNEFYSINSLYFGKMINRKISIIEHELNPTLDMLHLPRQKANIPDVNYTSEILYIRPHPGLDYRYYNFAARKPKAVLHGLYHSGTACTRDNEGFYSLVNFVKYCIDNSVDFYISPINVSGDLYLTSNSLIDAGAIPLQNISLEAGLVKLMLAYGSFSNKEHIREFLNKNTLFFEDCQLVY